MHDEFSSPESNCNQQKTKFQTNSFENTDLWSKMNKTFSFNEFCFFVLGNDEKTHSCELE